MLKLLEHLAGQLPDLNQYPAAIRDYLRIAGIIRSERDFSLALADLVAAGFVVSATVMMGHTPGGRLILTGYGVERAYQEGMTVAKWG